MVVLTADQFDALLSRFSAAQQTNGSPELDAAIRAISDMAKAQVLATSELGEQVKRTTRHSNAVHENVSVFAFKADCEYCKTRQRHPVTDAADSGKLGHPKPELRYETFFPKGVRVSTDELTVFETELFNKFETDKTARDGRWRASFSPDHKQLQIDVKCYFPDDRVEIPVFLPQILMELLYGADVVNPEVTQATIANLQTQINALHARLGDASETTPAAVGA